MDPLSVPVEIPVRLSPADQVRLRALMDRFGLDESQTIAHVLEMQAQDLELLDRLVVETGSVTDAVPLGMSDEDDGA